MSDMELAVLTAALAGYRALSATTLSKQGLPPLRMVRLAVPELRLFSERPAIDARLAACSAGSGWCRRESWVGLLGDAMPEKAGAPLDGEWVEPRDAGCRLAWDGAQWRVWKLAEREDGGRAALREDVTLLSQTPEIGGLNYAVYWGVEQSGSGLRRLASRFLGFSRRSRS